MKKFASLVVAAVSVLLAATAFAAPVREGAVSASAPVYAWDGGPGNGSGQGVAAARCTPVVYECEDTLVKVDDPGDLVAEVKAGEGANDLDVAIYKSDESGTTDSAPNADNPNAEDVSTGKDAKTTLKKVTPGYYVVRVRIFDGVQAAWKGTATLKVPPPPVPPATTTPPATTAPAPASSTPSGPSAKERRNACIKKAKKKFRGKKNAKKRAKAIKKCKKIR
jgi:hypothetical protein